MLTSRLTKCPDQKSRSAAGSLTLRYLEPAEYALWDALLDVSPQASVFCRSWWLRAIGDAKVLGCFSSGDLVAGMPLHWERRFGIPVCIMPRLTHTWGVVIRPLTGKPGTVEARETQLLRAFASRLSHFQVFLQAFHPTLSNWLPFYWSGFRQTTRFTYVLDDLTDLDRLWNTLSATFRRQILRAEKSGVEVIRCGGGDVYRSESQSYLRRGMAPPHDESLFQNIVDAAIENQCGACFAAVDGKGKLYAAWLHVWDNNCTYNLVGGREDTRQGSDANVLLIWHAIKFAAERSRAFDFAGSMVEGVAHFNRGFGARQVPYNYIMRLPCVLQCCLQWIGRL